MSDIEKQVYTCVMRSCGDMAYAVFGAGLVIVVAGLVFGVR